MKCWIDIPIIVISVLIGSGYAPFIILPIISDPTSAWFRFSHAFFEWFTIIPISVIGFGIWVVFDGLRKRKFQDKFITLRLCFCGSLIILLGFGIFGFHISD